MLQPKTLIAGERLLSDVEKGLILSAHNSLDFHDQI